MKSLLKFLFLLFLFNKCLSLHFDLLSERPRCYIEEFYKGNVAVIKYKLWSTPNNIDKIKQILSNIQITITQSSTGELLKMETVNSLKDKFSFLSKEDAYYKICVEKSNIYWGDREPIYFKLKVMSDNMDEPNISGAIKTQDLDQVKEKVNRIIKKGELLIKRQENELDQEDNSAKKQMESIGYYYSLAVIQIGVVIAMGLYQIFSFRKFFVDYKGGQAGI